MSRWARRVYSIYEGLLVSRRGAYSIERLLAFDDYCKQTSKLRAVAVCLGFPLLPIVYALIIEAVPLQEPAAGWRANPGFWVRFVASVAIIAVGFLQLALQLVPELSLSLRRQVGVCVISSAAYVAFLVLLANVWRFPVPFTIPVGAGPVCVCFFSTWILFSGVSRFNSVPNLRKRIVAFGRLLASFASLCLIYPTYNAIFIVLDRYPWAQNAIVLVLPLLRLLMRNVVANECTHWEDLMPEMTIFSVEVFNSIYMAQSVQTGNSSLMTSLVIVVDLGSSVYSLRNVHRGMLTIEDNYRGASTPPSTSSTANIEDDFMGRLLSTITSGDVDFSKFRVLGSFPHLVTSPTRRMELLSRMGRETASAKREMNGPFLTATVVPISPCSAPSRRPSPARAKMTVCIEQSLSLMFQCEYIILAEYVESIASVAVGVHLAVVFQLPNLRYYPHKASIEASVRPWIVLRLLVFVFLEFLSLMFVLLQLRRRLRLSTLHMLAFVLETQFNITQGKFAMWLVVLQFTLVHYSMNIRGSPPQDAFRLTRFRSFLGADYSALLNWIQGIT